tara:strand:- start:985 stop:1389 length:405 start_codon:yes stop_codon:yes gene_type:complete
MRKIFLDDLRFPEEVYNGLKGGYDENTLHPIYADNSSWIILRTYKEFITHIMENNLNEIVVISLDHDLHFDHYKKEHQQNIDYERMQVKTGYHAAKWLLEYSKENNIQLPEIRVHSLNIEGRKNIENLIKKFNP